MQARANPTLIGLFVLSAIALLIAGIFYLGGTGLSERAARFVLFFEGDVKGLQIGAPVTLRGVKVGQVEAMSITYERQKQQFDIPVIISIDENKLGFDDGEHEGPGLLLLKSMIEQGLRARLNIQSLVTGKMEVQLDFHPNTPVRLIGKNLDYPEIPTIPSSMEKIASALEELPLERMIRRVTEILDSIDTIITGPDIPNLINHLVSVIQRLDKITIQLEKNAPQLTDSTISMLNDSREVIAEMKKGLGPLISEWTQLAVDSREWVDDMDGQVTLAVKRWDEALITSEKAFAQIQAGASSASSMLRDDSPLVHEMTTAMRELSAAARSIRIMAEYLERHPDALLRGKQ